MIVGIYTSASALLPLTMKQSATANNMANISTPGFKRDSIFYRELTRADKSFANSYRPDWFRENIEETYTDFSQGQLQPTNRPFDVAIYGSGFFAVSTPEGLRYTRNGQLSLNPQGLLVDSAGLPVMGSGGQITIPQDAAEITITKDGEIIADGASIDRLKIVDFPKPYHIKKSLAGGFFAPGEGVREEPADPSTTVNQGALESSNAQAISEMVDMVELYKHFESDQRALQIQDQTLARAVNDVGVVRG